MFFLIPYGHEKQTVQRIPVVTIILVAINLIVFLFTHYSEQSWEALVDKHGELVEYVYTHAYLKLPPEASGYFEEWQLEELESFREMHVMSELDPEVVAGEQRRLDELFEEMEELRGQNPFEKYGYIPAKPNAIRFITSLFIHAGWLHLLGNMFFLYLAGCSIEDLWGRPLYTAFYLISGVVATLSHALIFPESTEPLVGASGAIAGLMGAFMIRLHNTQISFFYMFGLWYRGTFKAPAFLMLPLWLVSQIFYAMIDPEGSSGVAFWAHIGGFVFGALVALGIRKWKIEERFITPEIEKKVSLVQNADFLQGMAFSGRGNYAEALISLNKAVRSEPNHVDTYMEMRRIAQIEKNPDLFRDATGSALEILIRNREEDLVHEIYQEYRSSEQAVILPSRTLLALGGFYEGRGTFAEAEALYRSVAEHYPDDPLALKGLNKLSRLHFDRLRNPERGTEVFWEAYQHPLASEEWRAAMDMDRKKYGILDSSVPLPGSTPSFVPSVSSSGEPNPALVTNRNFETAGKQDQVVPTVASAETSTTQGETQAITHLDSADSPALTSEQNHPESELRVVPTRLEKITLQGLNLLLSDDASEFLPWGKIHFMSSAKIRIVGPASTRPEDDFVLLDLIMRPDSETEPMIYRISSRDLSFERIFPGVEQSFEEAYQNFVGIILNNSRAKAIPNRQSCIGPAFPSYPDLSRYEVRLKARLTDSLS